MIVGGAVRDVMLGRRPPDWDLATDLRPAAVATLFPRVNRAGEKHGTIMVLTGHGPVEVTTFRGEGPYLDGRRPSTVIFHDDLEADLARRDFTINAIAADLATNEFVDPFSGEMDLRRGRVRAVGDPRQRFAEDGLRSLRAIRLAAVLGFEIDKATKDALPGAVEVLRQVAWERRRDEMARLLAGAVALAPAVRLLVDSGLIREVAAELEPAPLKAVARLDRLAPDPWLRLAGWATAARLEPHAAAGVATRWRAGTAVARAIESQTKGYQRLGRRPPTGAALRLWLAEVGPEAALGAAALAAALRPDPWQRFPAAVRRTLARKPCLSLATLAVDGHDLEAAGFFGPAVGRILQALLREVLHRPALNQETRLLALAHTLSTATDPRLALGP
ncbi:MAG: tRNA cytidylyltransferase [Deltaproteobacteria bacterium]|nr:tRNA cytidylyltransferase [Deltaproteobacteria bacterium]